MINYQQLKDLNNKHESILKTGFEVCPCCGKDVPVTKMTASVSRGIICWDCDLKLG